MNKQIKKVFTFTALTTAGIYCANRIINHTATAKNLLGTSKANFYDWKNGDIFYTVSGSGSPILLVHDLHPASSSVEWSKIIKKLEKIYVMIFSNSSLSIPFLISRATLLPILIPEPYLR